ncbi:MAG: sodium:solute symporter [Chlorobi bacterium]|nr:sodium:solute symporter [Chlorobiota bacterium]
MEHFGFWSILPPFLAIAIAIGTKKVIPSIFGGVLLGGIILSNGNILSGISKTFSIILNVFKDAGNTRTILFTLLIGSLITLLQSSGGVKGFIDKMEFVLRKKDSSSKKLFVQFAALATGILIFIETNVSILTTGTIFKPVFDKLKISREKLAYIADSGASPVSVLLPFNAWGAFMFGILTAEGIGSPMKVILEAIPLNFYPLSAMLLILFIIYFNVNIGPMKKAEENLPISQTSNLTNKNFVDKKGGKAYRMVLPLILMVISMPAFLIYSGWSSAANVGGVLSKMLEAFLHGSGSFAVLSAVIFSLLFSIALYRFENLLSWKAIAKDFFTGIKSMLPLAVLMLLAFSIGAVSRELGTGLFLAEHAVGHVSTAFLPAIIFIAAAAISFSTGTSWGTFAIMTTIAIPVSNSLGANIPLTFAALLSGGVFGDHCSPISDTTIIASLASGCSHIDHVKTQLPYALISGALALFLFVGFGIAFN